MSDGIYVQSWPHGGIHATRTGNVRFGQNAQGMLEADKESILEAVLDATHHPGWETRVLEVEGGTMIVISGPQITSDRIEAVMKEPWNA